MNTLLTEKSITLRCIPKRKKRDALDQPVITPIVRDSAFIITRRVSLSEKLIYIRYTRWCLYFQFKRLNPNQIKGKKKKIKK